MNIQIFLAILFVLITASKLEVKLKNIQVMHTNSGPKLQNVVFSA